MRVSFTTMGSGSLAATSILETGYKDDMTQEEEIELVKTTIEASIFNDLGSGTTLIFLLLLKKDAKKKNHIDAIIKKNIINSKIMFSLKVLRKSLKKLKKLERY